MHNIQILIFTYWLYCYFRDVIRLPTIIHHVYPDENCEVKQTAVFGLKYGVNSCENAFGAIRSDNVCEAERTAVLGLNSGDDIRRTPTYLRAKKDL